MSFQLPEIRNKSYVMSVPDATLSQEQATKINMASVVRIQAFGIMHR